MLPFGRMLQYGKTKETPYIKDIKYGISSSFPNMILLSNGELYTGGYNDGGQLGLGDKNNRPRQVFKAAENVRLISCSAYASMYVSTDNRIYLAGDRAIMNVTGSAAGYSSYTDLTDTLFSSIDISTAKKIVCNYNSGVLLEDGRLYAIGLNRYGEFGLGSTGYKELTLIATDVEDFTCTAQVLVYQKRDGTVWGSGRNTNFALQPSDEGGVINENITSFRQLLSGTDDVIKVKVADVNILLFCSDKVYCTGRNDYGSFGDGNSSNNSTNTSGVRIVVPLVVAVQDDPYLDKVYTTAYATSGYVGVDNRIYSCGMNSNNGNIGLGVTSNIPVFTAIPDIVLYGNDVWLYGQYNSYVGTVNNVIYGCGHLTTGISLDVFNNVYTVLTKLPFSL